MTKLNQILAVEKGVKKTAYEAVGNLYKKIQKKDLFHGISRTYQPKDDEGDRLPSESTKLQVRAEDILKDVTAQNSKWYDVTYAKDFANTKALGTVSTDDGLNLENVPVTYLLFLEKQLTDLYSLVEKLPVLDPSDTWHYDTNIDAFVTEPTQTTRTKKVPRNHVKAAATDKHPAQVEVYFEDVLVGNWTTIRQSGALPQTRVNQLKERIEKVQRAVKFARERANEQQIEPTDVGSTLMSYLFS